MTAATIVSFDAGELTTAQTQLNTLAAVYKTAGTLTMWREGKRIHVVLIS